MSRRNSRELVLKSLFQIDFSKDTEPLTAFAAAKEGSPFSSNPYERDEAENNSFTLMYASAWADGWERGAKERRKLKKQATSAIVDEAMESNESQDEDNS